MDEDVAVVIDNGSGTLKAGFSGEDGPRSVLPNCQGTRHRGQGLGLSFAAAKDSYIGKDAQQRRHILKLKYPLENGTVQDWDVMSEIWAHVYDYELNTASDEHPALLTEVPLAPRSNREQMATVMFETFNVPSLYVATHTVGLYASGRTSGIVLSCGDGVTYVTAMYEGFPIPNAVQRNNIAGREVTDYFISMMSERGHYFTTSAEREIAREIKEDLGFISSNYNRDMRLADKDPRKYEKTYELPDGKTVTVGSELFRCAEALFNPSLLGEEKGGVHEMIQKSIQECSMDTRKTMWENIVLTGGCTLFPGFVQRLKKEIRQLAPATVTPKISAPEERRYSMWMGGSRLASLSSSREAWITLEDFYENGASICTKTQ